MDFGIFGFTPEQAEGFRAFMANQQGQGHPPGFAFGAATANANNASATAGSANQQQDQSDFGGASINGSNGGGDQQPEEPVLMHNAHHNGVVCDICNTEIRGFRYKCLQCADYDLCSKCEHKGHHAGHIMMRIAFPEQARDAIRRYMNNSSCPPSPPTPPRHGPGPHGPDHHGPHHGHGQGPHVPPGMEGLPFLFRRGSHCHRRRGGRGHGHGPAPAPEQDQSSGAEDNERPATAPGGPGCPYQMGKKEFKRWSKWMKRAAAHQHRSAEAYARAAAASGTNADPATASAENGPAENPLPMDFTAVASQIQEFLNYWGVPVDVVELYDQFGNRGEPGAAGAQPSGENQATTPGATGQGTNATAGNAEANNTSGTQAQQPTGPSAAAAENLSDNMQQMRLDETQTQQNTTTNNVAAATAAAPQNESLLMDLDAENSGWTIVNSREQSPGNGATTAPAQQPATPSAPTAPRTKVTFQQPPASTPTTPSSGSMNSNASNGNTTPFASAGSINSIGQPAAIPTTTPTAPPPTFPTGVPNVPLYPVLNQPQLQQILQGVSSAVNSVVRSIPIVTDPRGPMGTTPTSATNGQVPATGPVSATSPTESLQGELDARSMKTLNQLLAMGFSNEGGYLTRLVVAKKGDLEAVLSSLFPN